MRLSKKKIKERIYAYEWKVNGRYLSKMNGGDVKVGQVTIDNEERVVRADIMLYNDGESTTYHGVTYPFEIFK